MAPDALPKSWWEPPAILSALVVPIPSAFSAASLGIRSAALTEITSPVASVIITQKAGMPREQAAFAQRVAGKIISYGGLKDNWDDEGAIAPSVETVDDALAMLEVVPSSLPCPGTMVLPTGEIALYWSMDDVYAEIGFDGTGRLYAYATRPGWRDVHIDYLMFRNDNGYAQFPHEIHDLIVRESQAIAA